MNTTYNATYMTATGMDKLRKKLATKVTEHAQLCKERTTAHALSGDGWHDNPYHDRLQQLEAEKTREIAALTQQLDSARLVVVDPANRPVDQVRIGSIVSLLIEDESGNERQCTWEIVGYGETDVPARRIGYNTPLAEALMNEPVGSELSARLPGGEVQIFIVAIHRHWP